MSAALSMLKRNMAAMMEMKESPSFAQTYVTFEIALNEIECLTRDLKSLRQDDGAVIVQLQNDIREARTEIERLTAERDEARRLLMKSRIEKIAQ